MHSRALGSAVVGLLLAMLAAAEEPAAVAPPPAEVLLAEADHVPALLLWAREGEPTVAVRLRAPASRFEVPAGEGCLVAVREGRAPALCPLALVGGETVPLEAFAWGPGVAVVGRVTDPGRAPLAAEVRLEKPGEEGRNGPDLCAQAQLEGGISRGVTDDDGRFRLGPVAPGAWELSATADGRESVTVKLALSVEPATADAGTLVLREVAELDLSLDLSRAGEEPPFRLAVSRLNERWMTQSEEWLLVREVEPGDSSPMPLRLDPGSYRLVLSQEDGDLSHVRLIALYPGTNIVVLRPWPIRVFGTVSDADGGVEGAELELVCDDLHVGATTSGDGSYEVRLWTPARCGVSVSDPEGRSDSTGLDLSAAEPGDEVELSVKLPDNVVRGTVVDATTREAIAGARVSLVQVHLGRSGGGRRSATTDGEGRFDFTGVRGATAERTTLEAGAEGYLPAG